MYFRLHASILKLVGKPDSGVDAEVLVSFMKEASEGPFARGEEKNTPKVAEKWVPVSSSILWMSADKLYNKLLKWSWIKYKQIEQNWL